MMQVSRWIRRFLSLTARWGGPALRSWLVRWLPGHPDLAGAELLGILLADEDSLIVAGALKVAGEVPLDEAVLLEIEALISRPDPLIQESVAIFLDRSAALGPGPLLMGTEGNGGYPGRPLAIVPMEESRQILLELLEDPNPAVIMAGLTWWQGYPVDDAILARLESLAVHSDMTVVKEVGLLLDRLMGGGTRPQPLSRTGRPRWIEMAPERTMVLACAGLDRRLRMGYRLLEDSVGRVGK